MTELKDKIFRMMSRAEKRGSQKHLSTCLDVCIFLARKIEGEHRAVDIKAVAEEIHFELQGIHIPKSVVKRKVI